MLAHIEGGSSKKEGGWQAAGSDGTGINSEKWKVRLNPDWASTHLHGNQLHMGSNGGPIRPPVAKILHIYQLIGWGGYWCGRLWIVSMIHFVMPPKRMVNTHYNNLTYVFNDGCRSTKSKLNFELRSARFQPSRAQGSTCNYKKKTCFLAGSPPALRNR